MQPTDKTFYDSWTEYYSAPHKVQECEAAFALIAASFAAFSEGSHSRSLSNVDVPRTTHIGPSSCVRGHMTHTAESISHLTLFFKRVCYSWRARTVLLLAEVRYTYDRRRSSVMDTEAPSQNSCCDRGHDNSMKRGTPTGKIGFFCKKSLSPCQCLTKYLSI